MGVAAVGTDEPGNTNGRTDRAVGYKINQIALIRSVEGAVAF